MFGDELRELFGEMMKTTDALENALTKKKSPERIFTEIENIGLEMQVAKFREAVKAFHSTTEILTKEIKKLRKKNKKLRRKNRELVGVIREREIEIANLQRRVEKLNIILDNALPDDDETITNDETPANNETPAGNETSVNDEGNETFLADSPTDSPR